MESNTIILDTSNLLYVLPKVYALDSNPQTCLTISSLQSGTVSSNASHTGFPVLLTNSRGVQTGLNSPTARITS